jgi:peroxiredoxin
MPAASEMRGEPNLHARNQQASGTQSPGRCDHLPGLALPKLTLPSTSGAAVRLDRVPQEWIAVFLLPGLETKATAHDTDTAHCRVYREHALEFAALGVRVLGVSSLSAEELRNLSEREGIPFSLLSDPGLTLAMSLMLPLIDHEDERRYGRLALICHHGKVARVFRPTGADGSDAAGILRWVQTNSQ